MAEYAFDLFPANDAAGKVSTSLWDARLARLTVGDQLVDAEFTPTLFGEGHFSFQIHADHPDAQLIERRGFVAVLRIDEDDDPGEFIYCFFIEEGDFKALSKKEQAGRILTFKGPGGKHVLNRYRLGEDPIVQARRGSVNIPGKWTWADIWEGGPLVRFIEEAKAHPDVFLAAVDIDFTRTVDSNGNLFEELSDYQVDIGTTGGRIAADLERLGVVIQTDAELTISAYESVDSYGTDRTSLSFAANKVRFQAGVNIASELPRKIETLRARTHVLIQDRDGTYHEIDVGVDNLPIGGEPWMDFLKITSTNDPLAIARAGKQYLSTLDKQTDQCRVEHLIGPGGSAGTDGYTPAPKPGGDYWLGDLVTVHTPTDEFGGVAEYDYDNASLEVAAIRFFLRGGVWMAEAQLGAQYLSPFQDATERTITSVIRTARPLALCQPTAISEPEDILLVAEAEYHAGGGATLSGTLPTGYADGLHVAIAHGHYNGAPGGSHGDGIPDPPAGWTAIGSGGFTGGISGVGQHGAFRVLQPGDTSIGTWPDPITSVKLLIFSGMDTADPIGTIAAITSPSGQLIWSTLTPEVTDGSSRFVMFGVHESENIQDNAVSGTQPVTALTGASGGFHASWLSDPAAAWGAHDISCTNNDRTGTTYELRRGGDLVTAVGAGRVELIGTSEQAKRCDDTEHWHETGSGSPTVDDDVDAGFRNGTLWINDDGEVWFLKDNTAGAAVWVQFVSPGAVDLSAINFLVGTASGLLSGEIAVGTTPGGELGGTWASPTVDATHSGSTHDAATNTHIADTSAAHVASSIGFTPHGSIAATDVQAAIQEVRDEAAGGGAPSTVDYLVGTADGGLSNEIVVGTTPGGELGGTWASPTVDATHSGSAHHTEDHDHDGSPTQKLLQANSHESPDTDAGTSSLHHTIGSGANQAAAGNHSHGGGAGIVGEGLAIYHTIPIVLTSTATDNTANAALLVPILIPCAMRILGLRCLVGTNGSGTHEWGLFDYSSSPTSATKLAGGSNNLSPGAGAWGNIAAASAPVVIAAGAYALIFKFPAANACSLRITAGVAGCGAKRVTGYTWDDTPDLTSGFADSSNIPHIYLRGEYAGGTDY